MNFDPSDPNHYLNALPLSDSEKLKLGELAPKSAFDLLARRRGAKDVFDAYVGIDRADQIANVLESTLTPAERASLAAPLEPPRRLGARLDKP